MNQLRGWKLATIRGVPVYLHISLLFLLFYVVLIASAQFRFVARESGVDLSALSGSPVTWGLVFSLSLFLSVLLHEFGHVLVAQALGTKVRSITLLMLGGVSQMERLPDTRYAEFKVAIIGPVVSLAIAGGLFYMERVAGSANVVLFSYWLSRANLVLGIFNLLPAFPTDGGRVLRSILSARQGKLKGTRIAVQVSKVFAWTFGVIAVLQFNLILLLIAFFIYAGAKSELALLTGQTLLRGIAAGEVGRRMDPISDQLKLDVVGALMVQSRSLVLPIVTSDGEMAVINSEQIKRVPRQHWHEILASAVMFPVLHGVDVKTPLDEAMEHGLLLAVGGVPLTERGAVVGILRNVDLAELIELRSLQTEGPIERLAA